MLPIALVVLGIITRVLPHGWNFTPVLAVALFAGAYLDKRIAILMPLVLMIITDAIIGWHETLPFTWGSIVLIAVLGFWLRQKVSVGRVVVASVAASVLFFIITNLGSWPFLYPMTVEGLRQCFTLAVPFFRNTLISTLVYSAILFGAYEIAAYYLRNTRYAKKLLA